MPPPPDRFLERALALLETAPLIDGHNDLAIALRTRVGLNVSSVDLRQPVDGLDTDIPRLRAGRVGGQFWSVWVPAALPEERALPMALEQLDIADRGNTLRAMRGAENSAARLRSERGPSEATIEELDGSR